MSVRTVLAVATTAVAAAAIGFTAPSLAAHTHTTHKAAPLTAQSHYFQVHKTFDNFDSCTATPILTATVKAPAAGFLSMTSSVVADRDADNPNDGELTTMITVDGKHASAPANMPLHLTGVVDASVAGINGVKVSKGAHKVQIMAKECSTGMAFITDESLSATWAPKGSVKITPPAKTASRTSSNN